MVFWKKRSGLEQSVTDTHFQGMKNYCTFLSYINGKEKEVEEKDLVDRDNNR